MASLENLGAKPEFGSLIIDDVHEYRLWVHDFTINEVNYYESVKFDLQPGELLPRNGLDQGFPTSENIFRHKDHYDANRNFAWTALIVWANSREIDILVKGNFSGAVEVVCNKFENFVSKNQIKADILKLLDQIQQDEFNCADFLFEDINYGSIEDEIWELKEYGRASLMELITEIGDEDLSLRYLQEVCLEYYTWSDNFELPSLLQTLDVIDVSTFLPELVSRFFSVQPRAISGLLVDAMEFDLESKDWQEILVICTDIVFNLLPDALENFELEIELDGIENMLFSASSEIVANLLYLAFYFDKENLIQESVEWFKRFSDVIAPTRTIPIALSKVSYLDDGILNSAGFADLWQYSAMHLLSQIEVPLTKPLDWRIPFDVECNSAQCKKLQEFCSDSVVSEVDWQISEELREEVKSIIYEHQLDITIEENRQTVPPTLTLKKNHDSYFNRVNEYFVDSMMMGMMIDFPPQGEQAVNYSLILNRLTKAMKAGLQGQKLLY